MQVPKGFSRTVLAAAKLVTPLNYLRIQHPEKRLFDLHFPGLLAGILVGTFALMPTAPAIFGPDGLVSYGNGLLQVLVGFFIAALAAVATFQAPSMDQLMSGHPPKLEGKELTRRRFLAFLFGYLSFISIILYMVGVLSNLSADAVVEWLPSQSLPIVKWTFLMLYSLGMANLLVTTLLGLHYLTERIHRHESRLHREGADGRLHAVERDAPADSTASNYDEAG